MLEFLVGGETLIILRVGDCKALEVVRATWSPGVASALPGWWWPIRGQSWLWAVPTACVRAGAGERNSLPRCAPNVEIMEQVSHSFLGVAGSVVKMRDAFHWHYKNDLKIFHFLNLGVSGGHLEVNSEDQADSFLPLLLSSRLKSWRLVTAPAYSNLAG